MEEQAIRALIADHFGVEPCRAADAARFADDLGADSLDVVELTLLLEEASGVAVTADEGENCLCVGDVLRLIREKRETARAAMPGVLS
jgi:acyl carrier protein